MHDDGKPDGLVSRTTREQTENASRKAKIEAVVRQRVTDGTYASGRVAYEVARRLLRSGEL